MDINRHSLLADWPSQSFHFFPIEAANVVVVVNEGLVWWGGFSFCNRAHLDYVAPEHPRIFMWLPNPQTKLKKRVYMEIYVYWSGSSSITIAWWAIQPSSQPASIISNLNIDCICWEFLRSLTSQTNSINNGVNWYCHGGIIQRIHFVVEQPKLCKVLMQRVYFCSTSII